MTTPEEPRPGVEFGKPGQEADQADPTVLARRSDPPPPEAPVPGFGGAADRVPGTPPSTYPSYPSYPVYPARPEQQAPCPGAGYPPRPGHPPQPPYAPQPPYGAPYAGAYVPPPVYSPPGRPTPYGYVESQTPIFSIISFSLAAASVVAILLLCGFPALLTAPAGIVLGIIGHNKKESLGIGAAITNGVILALVLLVMLFVAGAVWSA